MASQPLVLCSVRRHEPVLVAPARATPYELKPLSDIDDQEGQRFLMTGIFIYRSINGAAAERDPVRVIKDALAKALVYYYPLAGRLREGPGRKLVVECTGEGGVFVEADADIGLEELSDALPPVAPFVEEFFCQMDASQQNIITNFPLFLIQVTRLTCGGFVFSIRINHVITDVYGLRMFMNTIADIARGASAPAVLPVWARELLTARDPPCVAHPHREYDDDEDIKNPIPINNEDEIVCQWFFFGPREIESMRRHMPPHLLKASTSFELLAACLWRSRTIALETDPAEEIRLICVVNARAKYRPPLPAGYYGNMLAFAVALSTAEELCRNPLGYALELVRKLKSVVTEDYMQSVADLMVLRGRPSFKTAGAYLVSDMTKTNYEDLDFGWGNAECAGVGSIPSYTSFFVRSKNRKTGEESTMVLVCLPRPAMAKFTVEIERIVGNQTISRL